MQVFPASGQRSAQCCSAQVFISAKALTGAVTLGLGNAQAAETAVGVPADRWSEGGGSQAAAGRQAGRVCWARRHVAGRGGGSMQQQQAEQRSSTRPCMDLLGAPRPAAAQASKHS